MCRLICKREERLGINGAHEIKSHSWFKEMSWLNLRERTSLLLWIQLKSRNPTIRTESGRSRRYKIL